MPRVVISERLPETDHLAWRAAIIRGCCRIFGCPFEQHRIVRRLLAWRVEVGRRHHVGGVEIGVELPEAASAGLIELRVKREALEAPLVAHRLHGHAPPRVADIEKLGYALAVVADAVEQAAHVVDEHAARARLVDEQHHARRLPIDVRNRCKLRDVDADDSVDCRNRRRERIVGRLRQRGRDDRQRECHTQGRLVLGHGGVILPAAQGRGGHAVERQKLLSSVHAELTDRRLNSGPAAPQTGAFVRGAEDERREHPTCGYQAATIAGSKLVPQLVQALRRERPAQIVGLQLAPIPPSLLRP